MEKINEYINEKKKIFEKAYKCCTSPLVGENVCKNCPYYNPNGECLDAILSEVVDFINKISKNNFDINNEINTLRNKLEIVNNMIKGYTTKINQFYKKQDKDLTYKEQYLLGFCEGALNVLCEYYNFIENLISDE